jgi:hypothetical protein
MFPSLRVVLVMMVDRKDWQKSVESKLIVIGVMDIMMLVKYHSLTNYERLIGNFFKTTKF